MADEDIPVRDVDLNANQLATMFAEQWDTIAPMTYSNYLKSGRGMLVVDLSKVLADGKGMAEMTSIYVPLADPIARDTVFTDNDLEMLNKYDPERMVLFTIKLRDGQSIGMFLGVETGLASPKESYEAQKRLPVH